MIQITNHKIPDFEKITQSVWLWKPGKIPTGPDSYSDRFMTQNTIPRENRLLNKLGISVGDKILSIASNHGDWAKAIAVQGCTVDYSDYSPLFVEYVKGIYGNIFNEYFACDFAKLPISPNNYDWTFSYEPVGIQVGLPLAIVRGLTNCKGVILLNSNKPRKISDRKPFLYNQLFQTISDLYGAKLKIAHQDMNAVDYEGKAVSFSFCIYELRTNPEIAAHALEDILNIERFESIKKGASLTRIERLTPLFKEKFIKALELTNSHSPS